LKNAHHGPPAVRRQNAGIHDAPDEKTRRGATGRITGAVPFAL